MREPGSTGILSLINHICGLNLEYAVEAMGGSGRLYEKMLIKIVRLIPHNIERMDECLNENKDLATFRVIVHGIKSSLLQAGCFELADSAERLEDAGRKGEEAYCTENYGRFRENLLQFYDQINEAISRSAGENPESDLQNAEESDINDYLDIFVSAKEAAENFDSMGAVEIISPLAKRRFDGDTAALILKAEDALEAFKPQQALSYIAELINKCGESSRLIEKGENS